MSLVPLVLGKVRRERWFLVSLFAVVPIGALFLSASRGGIISFAVEVGFLVLWLIVRRTAGKHLLSGGAILLLAFLMVSWLGVQQLVERFSSLQSLEVTSGKRAAMRADTWHIFLDHPWTGTGLGTLQTVFPFYETLYDGKIVNHTHNDYLEGSGGDRYCWRVVLRLVLGCPVLRFASGACLRPMEPLLQLFSSQPLSRVSVFSLTHLSISIFTFRPMLSSFFSWQILLPARFANPLR